ncbi:MAG: endonuclease/exonuclease/phosphatase family protein, partial [Myxococcaceae bacterium]|nr:endonuclease/exonuclease/phosphatase family protein [Myxococcaceae bacterium]
GASGGGAAGGGVGGGTGSSGGGSGGGQVGGGSGGGDAGADAGFDAGVDAGLKDAGVDAGVKDAGPFDAGSPFECDPPGDAGAPFLVRAVAANLSSGNFQSYDGGHGARILMALQPDVVMLQEFNVGDNSTAAVQAFVDATFDGGFFWVRGASGQQIPNGVVSRWPVLAQGEWADPQVLNRAFTYAQVDLPGPRDLWLVSVHLLTSNAMDRGLEAKALARALNLQVPAKDFLVIAGDMNTTSRSELAFDNLQGRVVVTGPYPTDQQGVDGTNGSRVYPFDNVLASPCLQKNQVPVQLAGSSLDGGLVFDTRKFTPVVPPALSTDSAAPMMQHMAVVKDFLVQP